MGFQDNHGPPYLQNKATPLTCTLVNAYFVGVSNEEPLLACDCIYGNHQGVTGIYHQGPPLSKESLPKMNAQRVTYHRVCEVIRVCGKPGAWSHLQSQRLCGVSGLGLVGGSGEGVRVGE